MNLTVEIAVEGGDWPDDLERLARQAIEAGLAAAGWELRAEVSILAADDARIAGLNSRFREKARPTNVLSWPAVERSPDDPQPAGGAPFLGDIALADGVIREEAAARGLAFGDHATHLIVHGLLHLLGYDHQHPQEAELMETIERKALAALGMDDPYAAESGNR